MNRRQLIKLLALSGAVTANSACFGSFKAIRWVYDLNKGISGNKFIQWLVFLGLTIIPVYGVAGLIDVWILNSIEFWFGGGTAQNETDERVVRLGPNETLWMHKQPEQGLLHMRYDGPEKSIALTFDMNAEEATVLDGLTAVARARSLASGGVEVRNDSQQLAEFDAQTAQSLTDAFEQGGAQASANWAQGRMSDEMIAAR